MLVESPADGTSLPGSQVQGLIFLTLKHDIQLNYNKYYMVTTCDV
jgi:hypothetical protein